MNFLITDAWAQGSTGIGGSGIELFIMIGVFFLIMYLLIIRPQNKRNKAHKSMLTALSKGDEIVTTGGILGKVSGISENFVALEIQDQVIVKIQKQAIASIMPKGTMRDA